VRELGVDLVADDVQATVAGNGEDVAKEICIRESPGRVVRLIQHEDARVEPTFARECNLGSKRPRLG
jgi:hypothetical protein